MKGPLPYSCFFVAVLILASCEGSHTESSDVGSQPEPTPLVVTKGLAQESGPCSVTLDCEGDVNSREALCGKLTAEDGSVWALPAPISDGQPALDVFNECTGGGANSDYESELTPTILSEDGDEITAFLFGDNYFEFYVNGQFMGRDAVAFTPFNSHVARYRVDYPVTYAVSLVDWEGYLGVGLEDQQERIHIGDAGFIATFSDGTVTNEDWKCRAFYVAPLDDPECLVLDANGNLDSSGCPRTDDTVSCVSNDPTNTCRGAHLPLPNDWMSPDYDDSGWLPATIYTADEVTNAAGFRNYEDTLFSGAQFIWTSNLNLDNHVVCRLTVDFLPSEPGDQ